MTTATFVHYFKCACGRQLRAETNQQVNCDCARSYRYLSANSRRESARISSVIEYVHTTNWKMEYVYY